MIAVTDGRILIADDEPSVRDAVGYALEQEGFAVIAIRPPILLRSGCQTDGAVVARSTRHQSPDDRHGPADCRTAPSRGSRRGSSPLER